MQLSPAAAEAVRLYRQFHTFKDDPQFAEMGFSSAGPYHAWLQAIRALDGSLDREAGLEAWRQLGIPIADVMMLGMNYMSAAGRARRGEPADPDDAQHVEDLERTLQASLAAAFCGPAP